VLVFAPVELMFQRADSNQLLDAMLLGELGSSLDEVVLVRSACEVIMSEIHDVLGSLKSVLKVGSSLHLILLKLHSAGERALELINRLAVGTEIEKSDL